MVAVKLFKPEFVEMRGESTGRIQNEAKMLECLSDHPGFNKLIVYGVDGTVIVPNG